MVRLSVSISALLLLVIGAHAHGRTVHRCVQDGIVSVSTAPEPGSHCTAVEIDDASAQQPNPWGSLGVVQGTLYRRKQDGRTVYGTRALPGSIDSPLSKGCHWLIKQGAQLVECADDVLQELGMAVARASQIAESRRAPADREARLLAALGTETLCVDVLCERTGLTAEVASAMLLTLELDGYVARLAGGLYQSLH